MFDILRLNGILQIDTKNSAFVHVIFCEICKQRAPKICRLAMTFTTARTRPHYKLVRWLDVDCSDV